MQAIIMAAGMGSRLGKLTEDRAKPFIEIKGKKLIEYNIALLRKYGIDDIIIITGHRADDFRELFSDRKGIRLVWNPFYAKTNVLGSFFMGMDYLNDDFIFLHADTLCDAEVFEELVAAKGDMILPIDMKPCDEEAMKVACRNGGIITIDKKIDPADAAGEFIGILKMNKTMLEPLKLKTREVLKEGNIMSFFEGAIQKLIDEQKYDIRVMELKERFWVEIDFAADYDYALENIPDSLVNICKEY